MPKKYIKEKGIVRAVTTDNLQLEKPLANENYDIEVHNRNMDKIDNAIQEVKGKVDGLELKAEKVTIADEQGLFEATNVEDALLENKTSILNNTTLANQALTKANEAFQRGDNVKTQLVDKLISEGLEVSTNNTFEELIGNIALGKKFAKGESVSPQVTQSFTYLGNNTTANFSYIQIPKLDFTPTLIVYICKTHLGGCGFLCDLKQVNPHTSSYVTAVSGPPSTTGNVAVYSFKANSSVYLSVGSIRLPVFVQGATFSWIAFE